MKYNSVKVKKWVAGVLGIMMFFYSGYIVQAATSDEVTLSISRPGAGYVTTISDPLRVRESPSTSANVLATLPSGSMITIVARYSEFYKVQYDAYGHYGYVSNQYVREYDLDYYCVVNTENSSLNMRAGAGTSNAIVASIPSGKVLPELIVTNDWDYVLYGNVDGYVSAQYLIRTHY